MAPPPELRVETANGLFTGQPDEVEDDPWQVNAGDITDEQMQVVGHYTIGVNGDAQSGEGFPDGAVDKGRDPVVLHETMSVEGGQGDKSCTLAGQKIHGILKIRTAFALFEQG